jgi:hypothetical protein
MSDAGTFEACQLLGVVGLALALSVHSFVGVCACVRVQYSAE